MGKREGAYGGSTAAGTRPLRLASALNPPVGCAVCSWIPDVWLFPFVLKAGLLVAVPRPHHTIRVHGAVSPEALCPGALGDLHAGPCVLLHTLHVAARDPGEGGPGHGHGAIVKLVWSQVPQPPASVSLTSVCFAGVAQPLKHLHPAPPLRRRQLTRSVQSSRNAVARSSHATQFCHPRCTLRAVSMTIVPRMAARSSSATPWVPMLQPVLRQVLLWETGVLALSVVSVPLISFRLWVQGKGQQGLLCVSPDVVGSVYLLCWDAFNFV